MKPEYRYFKVVAKCGHVGIHKYIPISFAVVAVSRKEAATKVRGYARVKHHVPDAIVSCLEIDPSAYQKLKVQNDADPYLHCVNSQEQRSIEHFRERVVAHEDEQEFDEEDSESKRMFHQRKYIQWIKSLVPIKASLLTSDY